MFALKQFLLLTKVVGDDSIEPLGLTRLKLNLKFITDTLDKVNILQRIAKYDCLTIIVRHFNQITAATSR